MPPDPRAPRSATAAKPASANQANSPAPWQNVPQQGPLSAKADREPATGVDEVPCHEAPQELAAKRPVLEAEVTSVRQVDLPPIAAYPRNGRCRRDDWKRERLRQVTRPEPRRRHSQSRIEPIAGQTRHPRRVPYDQSPPWPAIDRRATSTQARCLRAPRAGDTPDPRPRPRHAPCGPMNAKPANDRRATSTLIGRIGCAPRVADTPDRRPRPRHAPSGQPT
jgi:hypothetical protein